MNENTPTTLDLENLPGEATANLDPAEPVGCRAEVQAALPVPQQMAMTDDDVQQIVSVAMHDYFARTCLEVGTMLRQLGRRAIEIKPEEIQKFSRMFDVHVTKTPTGALRYEVTEKGREPSWAKGKDVSTKGDDQVYAARRPGDPE